MDRRAAQRDDRLDECEARLGREQPQLVLLLCNTKRTKCDGGEVVRRTARQSKAKRCAAPRAAYRQRIGYRELTRCQQTRGDNQNSRAILNTNGRTDGRTKEDHALDGGEGLPLAAMIRICSAQVVYRCSAVLCA